MVTKIKDKLTYLTRTLERIKTLKPTYTFALTSDKGYVGISLLALIFLSVFSIRVTDSVIVPFDSKDQYYPLLAYAVEQLKMGLNPLWNPAHYSGFPVAGDPQALLFSPLMILGFLIFGSSLFVYDGLVYFHLFLGATAVLYISKEYKSPLLIGITAAIVFSFGGPAGARIQHTPIIIGYAYFAILFYVLTLKKPSIIKLLIAGISCAMIFIHINQTVFILCLFALVYKIFEYIINPSKIKLQINSYIIIVSIGLSLAAIPMYHMIHTKSGSMRSSYSYNDATANSPNSEIISGVFFANINNNFEGNYAISGDITETVAYIGIAPFILILIGLITRIREDVVYKIQSLCMLGFFGISLLFALGKNHILYELYYSIPGASNFKRPSDFLFLANFTFCLALIASWRKKSFIDNQHQILFKKNFRIRVSICILSSFLILKTGHSNRLNALPVEENFVKPTHDQSKFLKEILHDNKDEFGFSYRVEALTSEAFWINHAMNHGLYLVYGYNPLLQKNLEKYYSYPGPHIYNWIYDYKDSDRHAISRLLGVKHIIVTTNNPFEQPATTSIPIIKHYLDKLYLSHGSHLDRFFDVTYRDSIKLGIPTQLVLTALEEHSQAFSLWLKEKNLNTFDSETNLNAREILENENLKIAESYGNTVLIELKKPHPKIMTPKNRVFDVKPSQVNFAKEYISNQSELDNCSGDVEVLSASDEGSKITINYNSNGNGMIAINELFNPLIKATIDGDEVPVYQINLIMRGVCVGNGEGRLEVYYPVVS